MPLTTTVQNFFTSNINTFARIGFVGAHLASDGVVYERENEGIFVDFDQVVSRREIDDYVQRIDGLNQGVGTHRNAINNNEWRQYYRATPRNFSYITAAHPTGAPQSQDSAPCADCGLLLPLEQMQIDHIHPQEGNPLHPIIKVFRSIGLTVGPPKGHFGNAVQNQVPVGQSRAPKGKLLAAARGPKYVGNFAPVADRNRHTSSDAGNAIFSLFYHAPGGMTALGNACLNSLVNLRPLCGVCNRLKSNTPRVFA
jgi:hypothetical protein